MDIIVIVGISLITLTIAVIGLLCGLVYFLFRQSERIAKLETQFQSIQAGIARMTRELPMTSIPPQTPNDVDPPNEVSLRRDELLRKLEANTITRAEAIELNEILVLEERRARDSGNIGAVVAIGLTIALLAAIIGIASRRR